MKKKMKKQGVTASGNSSGGDKARNIALKALINVEKNKAYSGLELNSLFSVADDSGEDRLQYVDKAFISEIVYGVLRNKLYIDYIIERYSKVRLKKISVSVMNILRMGVYQIVFMDRVPDSAACNESVMLTARYGHKASAGFVNAMLRNISRKKGDNAAGDGISAADAAKSKCAGDFIDLPDREESLEKYLSVRYSFRESTVKRWLKIFGPDFTEELMKGLNTVRKTSIRTNTLKISREELKGRLEQKGYEVDYGQYAEEALILRNTENLYSTGEFKEGLFYTQDEASMLVPRIAGPFEGCFVIDVCSAPGGKSTHLAQLMNNRGRILARDVHEHKIKLVRNNAERLGADVIETQIFNAAITDKELKDKADIVLLDCPCSGYGVAGRKPEIKWIRNTSAIEELVLTQKYMLKTASKYVKPGGVLIYSTCTVEPSENEDQVKKFLKNNPEFELAPINGFLPENLKDKNVSGAEDNAVDRSDNASGGGYITLYPHIHGTDGFFIARLMKKSN